MIDLRFKPRKSRTLILSVNGINSFLVKRFWVGNKNKIHFQIHENLSEEGSRLVMNWIRSSYDAIYGSTVTQPDMVFALEIASLTDEVMPKWILEEPVLFEANLYPFEEIIHDGDEIYIELAVRVKEFDQSFCEKASI